MLAATPGASRSSLRARFSIRRPHPELVEGGGLGVVQLPGLAQHLADRAVQVLGQALQDVPGLVHLAALDRRVAAEGLADRLGQRLRAIDDEQAAHGRIEAAPDQIVQQCLDGCGVLGRALDHAERVFRAVGVDADGRHQDQLIL